MAMVMKQKPQQCSINVSTMPLILLIATIVNRMHQWNAMCNKKNQELKP
jgi:hypothetical protein